MVDYVFGSTPRELIEEINKKGIDVKNIISIVPSSKFYLCFFKC